MFALCTVANGYSIWITYSELRILPLSKAVYLEKTSTENRACLNLIVMPLATDYIN